MQEMEGFHEIYQEIATLTTVEDSMIIYQHFKGLTVNFPTRLFYPDYVREQVKKEKRVTGQLGKREIQKIAIEYGYSERQIRRFLQVK